MGMTIAHRECAVCGKVGPADGPLSHEWDSHLVPDGVRGGRAQTAMIMSCSVACRVVRGLKERKAVANG